MKQSVLATVLVLGLFTGHSAFAEAVPGKTQQKTVQKTPVQEKAQTGKTVKSAGTTGQAHKIRKQNRPNKGGKENQLAKLKELKAPKLNPQLRAAFKECKPNNMVITPEDQQAMAVCLQRKGIIKPGPLPKIKKAVNIKLPNAAAKDTEKPLPPKTKKDSDD